MTRKATLLSLLFCLVAQYVAAQSCRSLKHLGDDYTVCTATEPSKIDLWLNDKTGAPYGEFFAVDEDLTNSGKSLAFAMNGGMYHDDRRAVGLFINDQGQQQNLMTREGPGNFGLLPNGVFCVADGKAQVIESRRFAKDQPNCRIATQSGPMLVIDGKLHPKFLPDSSSRKWRNGIGVDQRGQVHFAISDNAVRFHDFATLFRDALKSPSALFLDGTISRMHAPELNRSDAWARMGPIIGVIAGD